MQVQFPSCQIRCLIIHQYAPGIKKAGSQPCQITNIGKRGKAVKKMRFIQTAMKLTSQEYYHLFLLHKVPPESY